MLVDASGLIAMARIGQLDLLVELAGPPHTTPTVLAEATEPDEPGASEIDQLADDGGIVQVDGPDDDKVLGDLVDLGLGPGEASLVAVDRSEDLLVVDDANARQAARSRGLPFTGLLGLLVAAADRGRLAPGRGLKVLKALARSDFRMTVELYDWAREQMEA